MSRNRKKFPNNRINLADEAIYLNKGLYYPKRTWYNRGVKKNQKSQLPAV